MSSPQWTWNGARWWKVDFHTHTPASDDYGKGPEQQRLKQRTPREWLLDYMLAGIDCVAVTDHNSGAWVDTLKRELLALNAEPPDGLRPIHVFAGVEISVNGGIHLLAILGLDSTTSDIDSLLGAAGYRGTKGACDTVTSKSFEEVVSAIEEMGGLAIPAHVDCDHGLFTLQGTTLRRALQCETVFAMEVVDPDRARPGLFTEARSGWTQVLGSDSHHPTGGSGQRCPGSHFTWVKMGSPSLEGLRLALLDGPLSIRRSDEETGDPNEHAALAIESIEVTDARFMGRAQPFRLELNPWLNAIIGGRGTGKSTIVEFIRLALRREDELPHDLTREFEKYAKVYPDRLDSGLLTERTTIRVVYRKDGSRFRLQWSPSGDLAAIQQEVGEKWVIAEGDVSQRFPVRLYSQKQVFHLANTPLALLRVVDEATEVQRRSFSERSKEEESRFLSLRAKAREVEASLAEESRIKGELDDVIRKLAVFEEAGHADVLRSFQQRRRQQRAIEIWESGWANTGRRLREMAAEVVPDPLDQGSFDPESVEDADLRARTEGVRHEFAMLRDELEELGARVDRVVAEWQAGRDASPWGEIVLSAAEDYSNLQKLLALEGAGDPAGYGELVQRQHTLEQSLVDLGERKTQVDALESQAEQTFQRLVILRRELTRSREAFLAKVLAGNQYVHIEVAPYGADEAAEAELRRLLQREDGGFDKDIGAPGGEGLLGELFPAGASSAEAEDRLARVKRKIHGIAAGTDDLEGVVDRRFASHLNRFPPEALDRIDLWFPEDSLEVQYSTTSDGQRFHSIQEGSPGQKTAALLAFLLSYGDEPLVLDQPEDDLDNHLIYDLIVGQLREVKRRRQVIVVTHNSNIVVNGDAELVVALSAGRGESVMECVGSLQEKDVRNTICRVMEGGPLAFEQRYRRIALEGRNV